MIQMLVALDQIIEILASPCQTPAWTATGGPWPASHGRGESCSTTCVAAARSSDPAQLLMGCMMGRRINRHIFIGIFTDSRSARQLAKTPFSGRFLFVHTKRHINKTPLVLLMFFQFGSLEFKSSARRSA